MRSRRSERGRAGRLAAVAAGFLALLLGVALAWPLPEAWLEPGVSRGVLDRHGGVLAERAVPVRGVERWVELDQVAPAVVDALVASEDRRFRLHPGVDPLAVARAGLANLRAGEVVQGGSTLSQQTARLLAGRPPGLRGKVVEAWRAVRLDLHLTKAEILTWYLNRAYFGRGAWGIEAAARAWFDESAAGLSVAEAAALVALLPAPERLGPDVAPEEARLRRERVLRAMVREGRLAQEVAARAVAEPLQLRRPPRPGAAPHLAARLLAERPEAVIRTTIDPVLQAQVEAAVAEALEDLEGREVDHAAVLVADVGSGEVLAYVGCGDFAAPDGQVDGARARRSPGSTLKPFLYGLAFEGGMRPSDVLPDVPRRWSTSHGSWTPENYSGTFHGPVRARLALACSYNLPAVALLEEVGVATFQERLTAVGLHLPERPAHYGLGLALGGAEATLEELVEAYAGLARGGVRRPLRYIAGSRQHLAASPPGGPTEEAVRFLQPEAAWLVTDILSDPVARVPAFGRRSVLGRSYPSAAKTGTSTGFRDNWTVGYTPRHVVGVWVGNFDGRPMGDVSGVTGAGPLWARVMDLANGGRREAFPEAPPGLVQRRVCALSGGQPSPHCPHLVHEWAFADASPPEPCSWHLPRCEVAWPAAYRPWAAEAGLLAGGEGCPAEGPVAIAWPADGAVLYVDPTLPGDRQRVALRPSAPAGAQVARWWVDGVPVPEAGGRSQEAGGRSLEARWAPEAAGVHRIELEVDGVRAAPVEVWVAGPEEGGR